MDGLTTILLQLRLRFWLRRRRRQRGGGRKTTEQETQKLLR